MSGWRNTVEVVLFEISNSMKPYPPVFHSYTNKLRPVIGIFEPQTFDEVSNCIPPTSHSRRDQDKRGHHRQRCRNLSKVNFSGEMREAVASCSHSKQDLRCGKTWGDLRPFRENSACPGPVCGDKILHTRNQHLRNPRGFSVAFSNGCSIGFSNELSLVRGISRRILLFASGLSPEVCN